MGLAALHGHNGYGHKKARPKRIYKETLVHHSCRIRCDDAQYCLL